MLSRHGERLLILHKSSETLQKKMDAYQVDTTAQTNGIAEHAQSREMREYLRTTRGPPLESLSIYLIPVKASVLSRAVDLWVLRRLTLLNVGVQAPIWSFLLTKNTNAPLPLREIFTHNVLLTFLKLVNFLKEVHKLFLLERGPKSKPESFAPRRTTTIDHIRRLALKKHPSTLRKLRIKNLADTAWDVNENRSCCSSGRERSRRSLHAI
ncbi:hypothetical protein VTI74DRAFT_434 [Chaetomium olivicolor]